MYSRYPNYRFANGIRVPDNYSGNAFVARDEPKQEQTEAAGESNISADDAELKGEKEDTVEVSVMAEEKTQKKLKLPGFNFNIGKLFSGKLGFEEILLIGLIILMAQGESDDDIILLLALLLFIS